MNLFQRVQAVLRKAQKIKGWRINKGDALQLTKFWTHIDNPIGGPLTIAVRTTGVDRAYEIKLAKNATTSFWVLESKWVNPYTKKHEISTVALAAADLLVLVTDLDTKLAEIERGRAYHGHPHTSTVYVTPAAETYPTDIAGQVTHPEEDAQSIGVLKSILVPTP